MSMYNRIIDCSYSDNGEKHQQHFYTYINSASDIISREDIEIAIAAPDCTILPRMKRKKDRKRKKKRLEEKWLWFVSIRT